MTVNVIPDDVTKIDVRTVVVACSWDIPKRGSWIELVASVEDYYSVKFSYVVGSCNGVRFKGKYLSKKTKITDLLNQFDIDSEFLSIYISDDDGDNYKYRMELHQRKGYSIAALILPKISVETHYELIHKFFCFFDPDYGYIFEYPAEYDASSYISGIGSIRKGASITSNKLQNVRVANYFNSLRSGTGILNTRLRELYPYNLLNNNHLKSLSLHGLTLNSKPVKGTKLFLLTLRDCELAKCREVLEHTGLICSSKRSGDTQLP